MMPSLPLAHPGHWSWTIKADFFEHVLGFSDQAITGFGDDKHARFTQVRAIRRADVIRLEYVGEARLTTITGAIDATIADPWIELDPTAGAIGIRRGDGGIAPLVIARFAVPKPTLLDDGMAEWVDAVPVLSRQGAALLSDRYPTRTRLDPMTFTARLPA